MKLPASVLFALLFSGNLSAVMLCDDSCELSISFPEGGELQATEALTLSFGTGGVLEPGATGTLNTNPQPADTDYSNGGTLLLNQGDSISFDVNGSMLLGEGGNIDYSAMRVNSSGQLSLKAVGGSETLHIEKLELGTDLVAILEAAVIRVEGEFTLSSNVTVNAELINFGILNFSSASILNLSSGASGCNSSSANAGVVLSSGSTPGLVGCTETVSIQNITGGNINFTNTDLTAITDGGITASSTTLVLEAGNVIAVTPGTLVLDEPLEQKNSAGLLSLTGLWVLFLLRLVRNYLGLREPHAQRIDRLTSRK